MELCHNANAWTAIVAVCSIGYPIVEFWLGKTDRVKASSVIELFWMIALALGAYFIRRWNGKGTSNS